MKEKLTNVFFLLFPLFMGSIVGIIISSYINYEYLVKPPLAPPSIFFPIIWTIIYLLLGISYYLIKKEDHTDIKLNILYYNQLLVNALWSIIFFILKWYFISVIWIIFLLFLIIILIIKFYQQNKIAAFLNIPYLLWILFATYLTIGIYILN